MARDDIVLVPFPFDDLSSSKVRPAVCLTDPIDRHRHVVVAFISSNVPIRTLATDIVVRNTAPEFAGTGLRQTSCLRLHRLVTLADSSIVRKLGTIPSGIRNDIDVGLKELFSLGDTTAP